MTYKIITDDTGEQICQSAICTAWDTTMKNLLNVEDILSPAEDIANKQKILLTTS